jgi:hypothetical protein
VEGKSREKYRKKIKKIKRNSRCVPYCVYLSQKQKSACLKLGFFLPPMSGYTEK